MNNFLNLPSIYKITAMLGGRVEIYYPKDDKWYPYNRITGISNKSKIRVAEGDEQILESAKALVPQFYETIMYNDYEYLVPKNAMKEGSIIIMQYGLGQMVRVQSDGSLLEVPAEEKQELIKIDQLGIFYSEAKGDFEDSQRDNTIKSTLKPK